MATVNFFDAFQYKWAQTGDIFAWDDTQYRIGWATVGSTPPSVEQFNRVHQVADEKANWLFGQLKTVADAKSVTLSAGSLTGLQQVLAAYGQSSDTDVTSGRWMRVGAFGLGNRAPSSTTDYGYPSDFNQMDTVTGWVTVGGVYTNGPGGAGALTYTGILHSNRGGATNMSIKQEFTGHPTATNGAGSWVRYGVGFTAGARTWTAWEEVYTSRSIPTASQTAKGLIEIATTAETIAGSDATRAVSPQGLAAAVPTFAPGRLIGVRVFDTVGSSTYTPTAGTTSVVVEVQGGGGAGGGTAVTGSNLTAVGGGGGAGGYACSYITSGFSGVTVTVGTGGAPAAAAVGGSGGTSSFGALVSAAGGGGGPGGTGTEAAPWTTGGGAGGTATGGNVSIRRGGQGDPSFALSAGSALSGGKGGFSFLGGSGGLTSAGNAFGNNSANYGAGGSGVAMGQGQASVSGGSGFRGIVIVWEYA